MNIKEMLLSEYGNLSSIPSPINRMMDSFAADFRENIDINLGVGYVNEKTIPYELIKEALKQVLNNPKKYRVPLNYGCPKGSQNLINSIRKFHIINKIGNLTEELLNKKEIIIGPVGATSLLEGISHVLKKGIVITSDPMYYIYCNLLERLGFRVIVVPEDENGIRTGLLKEKLKQLGEKKNKISFFYIVTINNPTNSILSNARRKELISIVAELSGELGRKIPLFLDKAYEDLVHDPAVEKLDSGLLHDESGIVYELGTVSKILAPGLRIGYIMGSNTEFLKAMVQKTSDVAISPPPINQEIVSYLLDSHISEQIKKVNHGYREKAVKVRQWIDEYLNNEIEQYTGGKAGFYFYLTFKTTRTDENSDLFKFLSRTTGKEEIDGPNGSKNPRVIYIPGEFCVHPKGDMVETGKRQLRLSYGYEELENIKKAIMLMKEAVDYANS